MKISEDVQSDMREQETERLQRLVELRQTVTQQRENKADPHKIERAIRLFEEKLLGRLADQQADWVARSHTQIRDLAEQAHPDSQPETKPPLLQARDRAKEIDALTAADRTAVEAEIKVYCVNLRYDLIKAIEDIENGKEPALTTVRRDDDGPPPPPPLSSDYPVPDWAKQDTPNWNPGHRRRS